MTWEIETDLLRCSPEFYGAPRYDTVLYQSSPGKFFFARLIFIFIYHNPRHNLPRFPVALIQPFDYVPPTIVDKELSLCHLRLRPRSQSTFIPLRSILRGALVYNDPRTGKERDYLVVDTVDGDMFLRCKKLFPRGS